MMNASPQPDVPILVETPSRPVIPMVRCHYMSIEYDDPSHVWNLGLNGFQMPFLMLNLVGIVQQPFGATRFNSYDLIDQLSSCQLISKIYGYRVSCFMANPRWATFTGWGPISIYTAS
jgi:hypothetical protein